MHLQLAQPRRVGVPRRSLGSPHTSPKPQAKAEEHGDPKDREMATQTRPLLALSQVLCLKKSRETGPTSHF